MAGIEICTIQRAMKITGVSRRTIYNWMTQKRIRVLYTAGGAPRLYVSDLLTPHKPGLSSAENLPNVEKSEST